MNSILFIFVMLVTFALYTSVLQQHCDNSSIQSKKYYPRPDNVLVY